MIILLLIVIIVIIIVAVIKIGVDRTKEHFPDVSGRRLSVNNVPECAKMSAIVCA